MKNKFLLLAWLLAVPLLWGGCNWFGNDDDEITIKPIDWDAEETLPEITTTGENTFGCLVNGEVWRPKGGPLWGLDRPFQFEYHEPSGTFQVSCRRTIENEAGIDSVLQRVFILSKVLNGKAVDSLFQADFFDQNICSGNVLDPLQLSKDLPHHFELLYLNTNENIISGTFSFVATKEDCHDTIRVTDGRFDIKYAN